MKPIFAACLLLHITALIQAQVGIGTPTPSSKLEVIGAGTTSATTALKVGSASNTILTVRNDGLVEISSTTQGFLPPRVALTATNSTSPINSPATGLLVYNTTAGTSTATTNVTPGLYYYDGSKWQRIINQQPDATVSFNTTNPNTGSPVFTPNTPASTDYVYVSSLDNSQWTYNGTAYVTYTPPASTPWMLSGGTTDAGSNKAGVVYRAGSVGIGATTTPNANAQLDVNSTTKGFLPPRMTSTQRNSITSPAGMIVYNSSDNRLDVLQNTTWRSLASLDGTESLTNKTLLTPTITSGDGQYPNSLSILPTTHASSKRAAIWVDGWSILQDLSGNGTKNFSIGQTVGGTYPSRLFINTNGNIGIGNTIPIAQLDLRPNPGNATPGEAFLAIGTAANTAANTAGAGAIRYSTLGGGLLEYSNGTSWNTLEGNVQKSTVVAKISSSSQTFNSGGSAAQEVTGWSESVDINGNFDPATGIFTAPRNGNYNFSFSYNFSNGAVNQGGVVEALMLCSNSSKVLKAVQGFPAGTATGINVQAGATISFVVNLIAGETIRPAIYQTTGHAKTFRVGTGNDDGFVNLSIVEL
jgi:hypothetical protein